MKNFLPGMNEFLKMFNKTEEIGISYHKIEKKSS